jgi:hypothetical protein
MPVKWKIFAGLNIVHFILNTFLYVYFCIVFFSLELSTLTAQNWLAFLILNLFFLILIGNNLANQYILKQFFPDGEITRRARTIHNVAGFFYSVFVFLLVLVFINVTTDDIPGTLGDSNIGITYFFGYHLFAGMALLIMQYGLKGFIDRSRNRKIAESIKKIGTEDIVSMKDKQ